MAAMGTYQCRCGTQFFARVADRNRGWAKFCSKKCKAIEQAGEAQRARPVYKGHRDSDHDAAMSATEVGWDAHKDVF